MRGGRRGGLWSEWAGTLLSAGGGTILNVVLDIGMAPLGMSPVNRVERNRQRAGECRKRSGEEALRGHLAPGGRHR